MKSLSIRDADSLYWIGRYLQRFALVTNESIRAFDNIIDTDFNAGKELFAKLDYKVEYDDANDFFTQVSKEIGEGSLHDTITRARENAISIRGIIDDELFAPINIIYSKLAKEPYPTVKFIENISREIHGFWGLIFLKTIREKAFTLIEFGKMVETIDLKLRLFGDISMVLFDIERMNSGGKELSGEYKAFTINSSNIEKALGYLNSNINQIIVYEN